MIGVIWIFAAAVNDDAGHIVPHIAPYYPAVCANPTADEGVRVPGKYDDAGRVVPHASPGHCVVPPVWITSVSCTVCGGRPARKSFGAVRR